MSRGTGKGRNIDFQSTESNWSHPPGDARETAHLVPDHSELVAEKMHNTASHTPSLSNGTSIKTIVDAIAYSHDIGKLTPWFQAHLGNPAFSQQYPDNPRSRNHSKIGAAATWYALGTRNVDERARFVATVSVIRHHSSYPELESDIYTRFIDHDTLWSDVFQEQVKAIDAVNKSTAQELIHEATNGNGSWEEFKQLILSNTLQSEIDTVIGDGGPGELEYSTGLERGIRSEETYMDVIRTWSLLTWSDVQDAANISSKPAIPHDKVTQETITSYIEDELPDGETDLEKSLNTARNDAREEVLNNIEAGEANSDILKLTLPTGLGKTITGISAAVKLRDVSSVPVEQQNIVYALPYTSIIEQTADTFQDIFNTTLQEDLLTVHHHLRETKTVVDGEEYTDSAVNILGESWTTDLTLTTFVQLFESLTGPSKSESYKLPQLQNSIVILDEPQLLPLDWWPAITKLIDLLIEHYNTTVIYMTATQPAIAEEHEAVDLVDDPSQYVSDHPRVTYELHESLNSSTNTGLPVSAAANEVFEASQRKHGVLNICNTISTARELYEGVRRCAVNHGDVIELNQELQELLNQGVVKDGQTTIEAAQELTEQLVTKARSAEVETIMCQLTSRHRPADRSVLLAAIEELTNLGEPIIVTATQVVEAGVDLSFQQVYRDFGPVDSLVQAGGRCNRSYEQGLKGGTVTIWQLKGEYSTLPCELVYGEGLNQVDAAFNALRDVAGTVVDTAGVSKSLTEGEMREAVDVFHTQLTDRLTSSHPVTNGIATVDGEALSDQSMIDSNDTTQIMLPQTDGEIDVVEELCDGYGTKEDEVDGDAIDEAKKFTVSIRSEKSSVVGKINNLPVVPKIEVPFESEDSVEWYTVVDGVRVPDTTVVAKQM